MPMIQLTAPLGALNAVARRDLQKTLAATLLKWEGAPDTAFFRAQAWTRVEEADSFTALEDDAPRFRVDVTVPEGALSARRKEGLVKEVTALVLAAAGIFLLSTAASFTTTLVAAAMIGFGMGGELDVTPFLLSRYFGLRSLSALYGVAWMALSLVLPRATHAERRSSHTITTGGFVCAVSPLP